ncbi:DUF3368 domain-containing protein [Reichenbachiella sp. MALMAid0571]|uniref:DUF3368 domain-containing protein n=1 Tax=Reichenbachiella sp. MALMAid0571 TaxID=3143939 RepID=UPI0032DF601B
MLKVISNTIPILSLLKIDKLWILKELYQQIIIPEAVSNKDFGTLFFDLGAGESEVLILAKEKQADLVILDEIMGRRYAKQLDLKLTGTVGVLLKAKQLNIISSIKEMLMELSVKGTWLSPKLISKSIELAGEK